MADKNVTTVLFQLKGDNKDLVKNLNEVIAGLNKLKSTTKLSDDIFGNYNKTVKNNINIFDNHSKTIKTNTTNIKGNIDVLRAQNASIINITNNINKASNSHKTLNTHLSAMSKVSNVASQAMTRAFNQIEQSIHKAFEEYLKFEDKIMRFQGTFSQSKGTSDYGKLSESILNSANATGSTGVDAAASIQKFMPVLDDVTEATEAYTQAQIEAKAAHADLTKVTKMDIAIIKLYGGHVKDLANFHNQFNTAASFSNVEMDKLIGNFSTVAVRTASAGISTRKAAQEFAMLTNVMKSPEQAAIAYTQAINKIENPTKEMQRRIDELNKKTNNLFNVQFGASALRKAGGVGEWLKNLASAFEQTKEPIDEFIKTFKLVQAQKGAMGLLSTMQVTGSSVGGKSIYERSDIATKTNVDMLKNQYEKAINTIESRLTTMGNTWQNTLLKIFVGLEPVFQKVLDGIEFITNKAATMGVGIYNYFAEIFKSFSFLNKEGGLSTVFNSFFNVFELGIEGTIGLIRNLINTLAKGIETILRFADLVTQTISSALITPILNIKELFQMAKDDMSEFFKDLWAHPIDFWKESNKKQYFTRITDFYDGQTDLIKKKNIEFKNAWEQYKLTLGNMDNILLDKSAKKTVISSRPTAKVPNISGGELKMDPILKSKGNIEINNSKESGKTDNSLIDYYTRLKEDLINQIAVVESDNGLDKALEKMYKKYDKILVKAQQDLTKATNNKAKATIKNAINQIFINIDSEEKAIISEYKQKSDNVIKDIENANNDLKNRLQDISEGNNFSSIFALRDFEKNFKKEDKFKALLEKYGLSKEEATKAISELESNFKLLSTKSKEAFVKSREDFIKKSIGTSSKAVSVSDIATKEAQLQAIEQNSQNKTIASIKQTTELKKKLLNQQLQERISEIEEEEEISRVNLDNEINNLRKDGASAVEIATFKWEKLGSIQKIADNKRITETQITNNTINQIDKEAVQDTVNLFNSTFSAITNAVSSFTDDETSKIVNSMGSIGNSIANIATTGNPAELINIFSSINSVMIDVMGSAGKLAEKVKTALKEFGKGALNIDVEVKSLRYEVTGLISDFEALQDAQLKVDLSNIDDEITKVTDDFLEAKDNISKQISLWDWMFNAKGIKDKYPEVMKSLEELTNKANEKLTALNNKKALLQQKKDKEIVDKINENNDKVVESTEKSTQEIRDVNEKNYEAELSIIDKFYGEKRRKLESEVQKEIDIIKSKNERLKAIDEDREDEAESKAKHLAGFNSAIASLTPTLGADFYRPANADAFNMGDWNNKGNELEGEETLNKFDLGLISLEERNKKMSDLGLKKYLYFKNIYENTAETDIEQRRDAQNEMFSGQKQYYEYAFDKDKEQVESETKRAEERLVIKKGELTTATKLELDEIEKLDNAYKDSAGKFKTYFIDATRDWVQWAKTEGIPQLDVDLNNQVNTVSKSLAQSASENKGTTTAKTGTWKDLALPGESYNDFIARSKKEDAAASLTRLGSNGAEMDKYTGQSSTYTQSYNPYAKGAPTFHQGGTMPYDGIANLRAGERVLDPYESRNYNSNSKIININPQFIMQGEFTDKNIIQGELLKFENKLIKDIQMMVNA